MPPFHDITARIDDFCAGYLLAMQLQPGKN
jgi:hypothetical protein